MKDCTRYKYETYLRSTNIDRSQEQVYRILKTTMNRNRKKKISGDDLHRGVPLWQVKDGSNRKETVALYT